MTRSHRFSRSTAATALLALFLVSPAAPAQHSTAAAQRNDALIPAVAAGNSQFAVELYRRLIPSHATPDQNVLFSPYSISTALAMTYAGSRAATQAEMAATLHFALPQPQLHAGFAALNRRLQPPAGAKGYQLAVANALWGQQSIHFDPAFIALTNKYYGGALRRVDFALHNEPTRLAINCWIENNTAHKIKNLIQPQDLPSDAVLVLTNAIYFKGDWASKFDVAQTQPAPFHSASGSAVTVPMMYQQGNFPLIRTPQAQMIELPYVGGDLSMLVLLPIGDPDALAAVLSPDTLAAWRKRATLTEVKVFLPRFKFSADYHLEGPLAAMGMPSAFDARANFSGIGAGDLKIAHVLHQAMIDVNEQGSEAAASTAVVMKPKSIRIIPVFDADHPFLFLIVHKPTGSILFMGRYATPPAS